MENLNPPTPEIPAFDLGTDGDLEMGCMVADAKLAAMQQGFDDRYQSGVDHFFKQQCRDVDVDREMGSRIAEAMLEERRKTLIAIAFKTGIFGFVSITVAIVVGFSIFQAAVWIFPSAIAAICTSRK
jgi:hypothetical protein